MGLPTNVPALAGTAADTTFVQDNHSLSAEAGVVRGLHYQRTPAAQDKLLRVVRGVLGTGHPDVEDVLQESMAAVHRALPTLNGETVLHTAERSYAIPEADLSAA